jgi:hypothetical protein
MLLIAFGVLVCAYGELNLVIKGLIQQLTALAFEVGSLYNVRSQQLAAEHGGCYRLLG